MNLTLKQLFKYGAVCLSACALSASALDTVSDSFEAPDGSDGMLISQYKYGLTTNGVDEVTNYVWVAAAGDASSIVSNDAAYADITGDGPISNTTAELILNLETEGNTLSRTVGVSVASAPVYIDTLIKFTPSEDDPVIDTSDVKVALYVNAQSNLVVVHSMYAAPPGDYSVIPETNSVIAAVNPDQWYRLTMKVIQDGSETFTSIWLDGNLIMHTNAFDLAGSNGGTLFRSVEAGLPMIEKVSFQGTGLLDELVVSDEAPYYAPITVAEITLVAQGGAVTFDPVGPVNSGDTVTMTATDDWKVIASIAGPVDEAGMVQAESITTTLTASASCTVTAVVDYAQGNYSIGGGSYPISSVGPWAVANGLGEVDVTAAMEDDYLLNVAPATDATISIVATAHAGATITVTVGSSDPAVDFQDLNGTLKLYSRASLTSGSWTEFGSYAVGGGSSEVDIVFDGVNPTDFFKAVVE